ncbi:MAG: alpha-L-rhamnosidase C-terminal domain-containing protein, partial [Aristaeellaceae bacterium]
GFDKWHKGFVDSPEWGSACVLNPWHLYRKYGNLRALRHAYPTMKRYVDYLTSRTHHGVLHHGLGDWLDIGPCTPYSQNTPVPVTATCLYAIDLDIMAQAAHLLGMPEDAQAYEQQLAYVREEYNAQFLDDQTGRYANGSQACQALSLMAGMVPEGFREKAVKQMKDEVVKRKYAITAGDVGHPYLVSALMTFGMSDILHTMTQMTETPGYGYQVRCGATTLTEEWDGPDPARPHGSQNHLMLGSLDEWFFSGLAGIGSIRTQEQFDQLTICPHFAQGLGKVSAWTMHPYGRLAVQWTREGAQVRLSVTVPPNTTAHIRTESGDIDVHVGSGDYTYCCKG